MERSEIIIPVFNGERHLGSLLESLSHQTIEQYSVTIADNGSTDGSIAVAESFRDIFELKIIDASRKQGKAVALNEAVIKSSAQKLIFVDQDDMVNTSYVESMAEAIAQNPLVASTMDGELLNKKFEVAPRIITRDQRLGHFAITTVSGGTMGMTRKAFEHIGGFNEDFNYSTNDAEFCQRAYAKGYDFKLVYDATLFYRLRDTLIGNLQQGIGYGIGNYQLAKIHPEMRGDQATSRQLLQETIALAGNFIANKSNRARNSHLIGKNVGQMQEKLRTFLY